MKTARVADSGTRFTALHCEIRRSDQSRYHHRLHGVWLVAQGMSCQEVGRLLGASTRSVQYWVQRFEQEGLAGLAERDRAGRPARLSESQLLALASALQQPPSASGLRARLWDGKTVATFIERRWNIELGQRQCQRLFRRLRGAGPVYLAGAGGYDAQAAAVA